MNTWFKACFDMKSDAVDTGWDGQLGFNLAIIFELELSHVSFGNDFAIGVDSPVRLTAQFYGSTNGLAPFVGVGVHGANDLSKK